MLATVAERWPLKEPSDGAKSQRGLLAQFMTLHTLRSNAAKSWVMQARQNSLDSLRSKWTSKVDFSRFEEIARSETERAKRLLTMTNKIATALGSMNWTLFRFDGPWLITSDHPVCPVPLMGGEGRGVGAMPADGWANTLKVRFPISPYLGLLCSRREAPDPPIVDGTWDHASNFNAALKAQAEERWFRVPGPMPPFPSRIFRENDCDLPALAPQIFPGYDSAAARRSRLRAAALKQIQLLIERQDDTTMVIIRPVFTAHR